MLFCKCPETPVDYVQVVHSSFIKLNVVHHPMVFDYLLLDDPVQNDSKHVHDNFHKDCKLMMVYHIFNIWNN